MKHKTIFFFTSILVSIIFKADLKAQDEWFDLAKTPPMGWNSWNRFGCDISETLIRETADAIVKLGLKDSGYEYLVLDDCWLVSRDSAGNMIPDPNRFPNGMKALGDYIHSLGLKFGIYTDAGTHTCEGRPGARGYEYQDMRQFANWGVDYIKVDWCSTGDQNAKESYRIINEAMKASGRPMIHSICDFGFNQPWLWGKGIGHLWRTTFDIEACWDCFTIKHEERGKQIENNMGFTKILDKQVGLEAYAGPGHWNDPDMLQVGNGELTYEENKAHFSLWCILAAPLMMGNDIQNMPPETFDILSNTEIIAIDQDEMGRQGVKVRDDGDYEVWAKQLKKGSRAIVFFNRSNEEHEFSVTWEEIGYPDKMEVFVRDLWQHEDMGVFIERYTAKVPAHGVVVVKLSQKEKKTTDE